MADSWDKMRKAKEEQFFKEQEQAALHRLRARKEEDQPRLSPITGKPMEEVTYMGVVIDRCPTSGGIWLDAGELEEIVKQFTGKEGEENQKSWVDDFFSYFASKKSNK